MKKGFAYLAFMLLSVHFSNAQDLSLFQKKWMVQHGDTLPYRVLLPLNYDSTKTYQRGRDNEKQLIHGAKLLLKDEVRSKYSFIAILPQCPPTDYWANVIREHDETGKRSFYFLEEGVPGRYMVLLQVLVKHVFLRKNGEGTERCRGQRKMDPVSRSQSQRMGPCFCRA